MWLVSVVLYAAFIYVFFLVGQWLWKNYLAQYFHEQEVEELKTTYQHKKDLDAIDKLFGDGKTSKKE